MNRRNFIVSSTAFAVNPGLAMGSAGAPTAGSLRPSASDLKLRIAPCRLEIGRGVYADTTAYNGQVPGPALRLKRGKPVSIEVTNSTSKPEIVHWHGLTTDVLNDGAAEEGSPLIAPGASLRYHFTPTVSGTRWYHTHAMAMDDLSLGAYTGQFGFLFVDGEPNMGAYDQEVSLAIHHWGPRFVPMVETIRSQSENVPQTSGSDVGYTHATLNAHVLGHGDPIRVRQGERVLFRMLNASATENVSLALPGHTFRVVALDGNPVPYPQTVEVISLAVAERVDAIVEMSHPGVFILGSILKASRDIGLGVVIEYAGKAGEPVWRDPSPAEWDYARFARNEPVPKPDETFVLTFRDAGALNGSKFDTWTINGDAWPNVKPMRVRRGGKYRMLFRNATGDQHPMHLHRHSFEVIRIGDRQLSGLIKDTINVMPLQTVAVDFIANNPGDSLLHCHQQLHMDYGFMQIVKYID